MRTESENRRLRAWGESLRIARESRGLSFKEATTTLKKPGSDAPSVSCWWNWENGLCEPQGRHLRPLLAQWPELGRPKDARGLVNLAGL